MNDQQFEFEMKKHRDEVLLRSRELDLETRRVEIERQKLESEVLTGTSLRSQVTVPVVRSLVLGSVSVVVAIVTGLYAFRSTSTEANAALLIQQETAKLHLELLLRQQRFDLISKATKDFSRDVGLNNLTFLLNAGILNDEDGKIAAAVKTRLL